MQPTKMKHRAITLNTGTAFFAEQIVNIDLCEQIPTQDSGECEEQEANCDEYVAASFAEQAAECDLSHICFIDAVVNTLGKCAVAGVQNGDNYQSGDGNNNKHVDEYRNECQNSLFVGVLHICHSVCVRGGAHACFVGEEATLSALRKSSDDAEGNAAKFRIGIKGEFENEENASPT